MPRANIRICGTAVSMQNTLKNLPAPLNDMIGSCHAELVTIGWSQDTVYRLHGETTRYLKIGASLSGECDRLCWLEGRLPVPRVLHYAVVVK